ncbi:MAG: hypothetical protein CVU69_05105 [Deltaproteobacteria bacterium HGW-Deltaproteobacteria-4]|nr:MAG: hypothetical protein CVU69_05105 [Deltaproteobacteria bacterium HGW-Deltaproteobacteria-4]
MNDKYATVETVLCQLLQKLQILAGLKHLLWVLPLTRTFQFDSVVFIGLRVTDNNIDFFFYQTTSFLEKVAGGAFKLNFCTAWQM